jgi:hypothetical protein
MMLGAGLPAAGYRAMLPGGWASVRTRCTALTSAGAFLAFPGGSTFMYPVTGGRRLKNPVLAHAISSHHHVGREFIYPVVVA